MKMPLFIVLVVAALSSSVYAQSVDAGLEVVPSWPVRCDLITQKDYRFLNWVSAIEKVSEDNNVVTFRFRTRYGSCDEGVPAYNMVDARNVRVPIVKRKFSLGRQEKGILKKKIIQISNTDLMIELTFDKTFCFKNGPSRTYDLIFYPGINAGVQWVHDYWGSAPRAVPYPLRFWWYLRIYQMDNTTYLSFSR